MSDKTEKAIAEREARTRKAKNTEEKLPRRSTARRMANAEKAEE